MDEERDCFRAADSVRMTISAWDDEFIRGTLCGEMHGISKCVQGISKCVQSLLVRVPYVYALPSDSYGNEETVDWSYLRTLLEEGMQLNLVQPRLSPYGKTVEESVAYPDLIIVEPDYLVDISAIAACFESYGTTPIAHLLNKIKASQKTAAIALGNFASQLLDEEVNATTPPDYVSSAQTFFKNNAMTLLVTPGIDASFHRDARLQRDNIRRAVRDILPASVENFAVGEVMLEPSFFSEMLGLQGRMDFLTADHGVLLEQKAGKCAFPQPTHPEERPSYQEKHYVQMLLYMALLRYNHGSSSINAFLLYSKYASPLVGMGYNCSLVFEAMKVRNGIVSNDMRFARDGMTMLDTLTPDAINTKNICGKLWESHVKPQLSAILQPMHDAPQLERAYVHRLLAFVQQEHILAKLGSGTEENPGFASKWRYPLADKLLAGNICAGLSLLPIELNDEGKVEEIEVADEACDSPLSSFSSSNFRAGDIVILYPYDAGCEPDCRRTMVFRCTIKELRPTGMTLTMRTPQTGDKVFRRETGRLWAIEHDFFESSFTSLYRGTYAFLSAPRERRDLILMRREPRTDATRVLRGDYGAFNELSLRVKQACDIFLIIGPPGAGKTSFGMLNTLLEELREPDTAVIVMAYTNRAVDEICSKLMDEGVDFIRMGSRLSCPDAYHDHLLSEMVHDCKDIDQLKAIVVSHRVFVGTTTAFNSSDDIFKLRRFSLAIIDEASQILEPHLLGLLSAMHGGECAIRKFVMIGDHKQLPAVVQQDCAHSRVDDALLRAIGLTDCRLSLFERLLKQYRNDPRVVYMLTRQGRMHDDIALFPNQYFYGGKLRAVPLPHQTEAADINRQLAHRRVAFVDVTPSGGSPFDKVNESEAAVIAKIVYDIYQGCVECAPENGGESVSCSSIDGGERPVFDASTTVGVIVPYRNQIAAVRDALAKYAVAPLLAITIDTVERYQGSQRDNIIYGFTVSKPYQLRFLTNNTFEEDGQPIDRKLNVALTRARKHLFVVGQSVLLREVPLFASLIDFCREMDACFSSQDVLGIER